MDKAAPCMLMIPERTTGAPLNSPAFCSLSQFECVRDEQTENCILLDKTHIDTVPLLGQNLQLHLKCVTICYFSTHDIAECSKHHSIACGKIL